MASNGFFKIAKNGKCRMCQRVRSTDKYLKRVGEVAHGFATGYIWECTDISDCEKVIESKLKDNHIHSKIIIVEIEVGRYSEYVHRN